jgi:hypothetical protein
MSREVRIVCVWLIATVITLATGCSHKPAYTEMDANRGTVKQNQNQANASQAASPNQTSQPSSTEPSASSPESSVSAPTPTTPPKRPSFLDEAKGGIKDLPSYPGAFRLNVQVGPIEGVNTMSLGLRTKDSMDKITAFYEQVIKANKWTVVDKVIDPELSEWTLKKGEQNSAKVQVKKDLTTGMNNIIVVRAEKSEEAQKSAK